MLAWLLVGLMCYLPANLLPMLRTRSLGRETDSTIVGGVIAFTYKKSAYRKAIAGLPGSPTAVEADAPATTSA